MTSDLRVNCTSVGSALVDVARERARIIRLQLEVLECPASEARRILMHEIDIALEQLLNGNPEYARQLYDETTASIAKLRKRNRFGVRPSESAIGTILAGVSLYSAFVLLLLGPCVVVVASLNAHHNNSFTALADTLGLIPLFDTVRSLGIRPEAYLWGLLGGAGAVVSMVKRFEQLSKSKAPFWLLFGEGLFNPIVGSLSAVVVCNFIYNTDQLKALQAVPTVVVAFFAGFSERLLGRVEAVVSGSTDRAKEK
jgi:hypothetical protein